MCECNVRGNLPRYFVIKPQASGYSLHYWQPGKHLVQAGFKTAPLGKDCQAAIAKADHCNAMVDKWRGGLLVTEDPHGTLPWLIETYKASPDWHNLKPVTQKGYRCHFKVLCGWSARRGDPPMRAIKKRDADQLWGELKDRPSMASAVIARASHMWNYAMELGEDIVERNPFSTIHCHDLPPRTQVWRPGQVAAVIEVAIARGRPSVALGVLIAAYTAQRLGDIVALKWSQYDGDTITLTQSKTGAHLQVPCIAALKSALDDARSRVTCSGVVPLRVGDQPIIVNEYTGRRYMNSSTFGEQFRTIAGYAGIPTDLQFRDLRRTATVALAEAGCEIPEIAAFGGWSIRSVHEMLKVYCPLNLTMARNGLVKLEGYLAASG